MLEQGLVMHCINFRVLIPPGKLTTGQNSQTLSYTWLCEYKSRSAPMNVQCSVQLCSDAAGCTRCPLSNMHHLTTRHSPPPLVAFYVCLSAEIRTILQFYCLISIHIKLTTICSHDMQAQLLSGEGILMRSKTCGNRQCSMHATLCTKFPGIATPYDSAHVGFNQPFKTVNELPDLFLFIVRNESITIISQYVGKARPESYF